MIWTLFVLDMDWTYSIEEEDSVGVQPFVYLIPLKKQSDVKHCAMKAGIMFNQEDYYCDATIGDIFEKLCEQSKIEIKPIGSIDLTFGERQDEYLENSILKVVV